MYEVQKHSSRMPEAAFVCLTYYFNAEAKRLHVRVVDAEATKGAHVACLILGGMKTVDVHYSHLQCRCSALESQSCWTLCEVRDSITSHSGDRGQRGYSR
jgi:hypothetical protein